jgi:RNA polymerase sigma factor for flagellar operon FliA
MPTSKESARQWIEEGQRLVHSLANRISRNIPVQIDLDDLIAYGQLGLAEAARDFDPSRGAQFTTFAYYRVRGAIYDGVSKMSWTSRARYNRFRYEQLANEALREINESSPFTDDQSLEDDANWLRGTAEKLAMVYLIGNSREGDAGIEEAIEDPAERPETRVANRELAAKLRELVATLPPSERRLIQKIYFDGATL